MRGGSDVLRDPTEALAVALAHDDGAHEDLDGPDVLEGDLALAGGLVEPDGLAQFLLRDGTGRVDLVAKDEEGHFGELLDREERVELGARLGESLVVLRVDEEDDAVHLGEVVLPQTTCLLVSAEIVRGELDLADREFFRGCVRYSGWQKRESCRNAQQRSNGGNTIKGQKSSRR